MNLSKRDNEILREEAIAENNADSLADQRAEQEITYFINGIKWVKKSDPKYLTDEEKRTVESWVRIFNKQPDKVAEIRRDPCAFMAKPVFDEVKA